MFFLGFFSFCALSMSIVSICCDGPRHSHCVWHSLRSKRLATALETTTTFTTFQRFGPVFVPIGFQRMWRFPNRKDLQQPREGDSKEKPGSLILGRLTRWIGRWCLGKQKTTRWRSILFISNNSNLCESILRC